MLRRIARSRKLDAAAPQAVKAFQYAQGQPPLAGLFASLFELSAQRGIDHGQLTTIAAHHVDGISLHFAGDVTKAHLLIADCLNILVYLARAHASKRGLGGTSRNGSNSGNLRSEVKGVLKAYQALGRKIEWEIGELRRNDDRIEPLRAFESAALKSVDEFKSAIVAYYSHAEWALKPFRENAVSSFAALSLHSLKVQRTAGKLIEAYFTQFADLGLFAKRAKANWRISLRAVARRRGAKAETKPKKKARPAK